MHWSVQKHCQLQQVKDCHEMQSKKLSRLREGFSPLERQKAFQHFTTWASDQFSPNSRSAARLFLLLRLVINLRARYKAYFLTAKLISSRSTHRASGEIAASGRRITSRRAAHSRQKRARGMRFIVTIIIEIVFVSLAPTSWYITGKSLKIHCAGRERKSGARSYFDSRRLLSGRFFALRFEWIHLARALFAPRL